MALLLNQLKPLDSGSKTEAHLFFQGRTGRKGVVCWVTQGRWLVEGTLTPPARPRLGDRLQQALRKGPAAQPLRGTARCPASSHTDQLARKSQDTCGRL